jgi:hypothetical protein
LSSTVAVPIGLKLLSLNISAWQALSWIVCILACKHPAATPCAQVEPCWTGDSSPEASTEEDEDLEKKVAMARGTSMGADSRASEGPPASLPDRR